MIPETTATPAIVLALLHYARHASDCEHIALSEGCLLVERESAGSIESFRLDPYWTRIALPGNRPALIELHSRKRVVAVGSFVSAEVRRRVAEEMRRELRAASALPQPLA